MRACFDVVFGHGDADLFAVFDTSLCAHVAVSNDSGKAPFPGTFWEPVEHLVDGDLADDGVFGWDIADLLLELVASVLFEEAGDFALEDGSLEALSGLFLFIDFACDFASIKRESEATDGSICGEWEFIGDEEGLCVWVEEDLF